MSKQINRASGKGLKASPKPMSNEIVLQGVGVTPISSALSNLEDRCTALECLAIGLEERLGPVLGPGGIGCDGDESGPDPVRSPVVESIDRCSKRLTDLHERLTSMISQIEC